MRTWAIVGAVLATGFVALFAPAADDGGGAGGAGGGVFEKGATLEKLAGGFKFTEGPAADADGNVYFTDQPNDRIVVWTVDGKTSDFLKPCGRSNGLCFDRAGRLLACADENNQLWSIDVATKKVDVLVKGYKGKLLNGPNDVWAALDGSVYFTDPLYPRDYWKRDKSDQQGGRHVYRLSPDGKSLDRVIDDLKQPNGIIGTPDGRTLYVADINANKTYAWDLGQGGKPANKRLFCEMGSDGMTIDAEGNVYLTGRGVTVFDKSGKKIDHVDVPEDWTANVCFGGKDGRMLVITASKGLYGIRTRTKGAASQ